MWTRHLIIPAIGMIMAGCGADDTPTTPDPAVPDLAMNDTPETTMRQGWLTVRKVGDGPDVILLPGLASSASVWDGTVAALSGDYTLHVAQVAGFAGAPVGEDRDTFVAGLAGDLAEYIEERDLQRPQIIGHSLGGFTALHVARDQPDLIGGVTSVDSLPFYPLIFDPNATAESVAPQAAAMADQIRSMPDAQFDAMQAQTSAMMSKTPSAQARIKADSDATDRDAMADAMLDLMTSDLRGDLADIDVPVTIIYAHDPSMGVPAAQVDAMYSKAYADLPDGTLIRIDGSYHFIMDDQPDAFLTALSDAISQ